MHVHTKKNERKARRRKEKRGASRRYTRYDDCYTFFCTYMTDPPFPSFLHHATDSDDATDATDDDDDEGRVQDENCRPKNASSAWLCGW